MKNILIVLITSMAFTICSGQNEKFLAEKSIILKNQSESLLKFSKIANIIDSDDESYWAYKYADIALSTIDKSGKNYYYDLKKIYSAYSLIFFGMSYTRTVMAISRGDNYTFKELNGTIIKSTTEKNIDFNVLSKDELSSIYSIINFYKVGRMPRYGRMMELFQNSSAENKYYIDNKTKEQAFKLISLNNKKLYFKIFAGLIVDIYGINNQDVDDNTYNNFVQLILKQGEKMDEIPTDEQEILNLNDSQYYKSIVKSSEVQKELFDLLIKEIEILELRNQ
jgi:hypothetical protein